MMGGARSWGWQVLHVARKDLRFSRGFVVVYAGAVAAMFANTTTQQATGVWLLLPLLMGMLYAGYLIQEDSPYRSDALWATLPLHPSAVCAAKLLLSALVVTGIALVGHTAALIAGYGTVPPQLPSQVMLATAVSVYLMLTAAVLAAATRDMAALLLVLIGEFIVLQFAGYLWQRWLGEPGEARSVLASLATNAIECAILVMAMAYVYRSRNRNHAIALAVMLLLITMPLSVAFRQEQNAAPVNERAITATQSMDASGRLTGIHFQIVGPSHLQYVLTSGWGELRFANGSMRRITIHVSNATLNSSVPPDLPNLSYIGEAPRTSGIVVGLDVRPDHQELLRSGAAQLIVHGRVEVLEPVVQVRVPLKKGSEAADNGARIKVLATNPAHIDSLATVHRVEVSIEPRKSFMPIEYIALNRSRGEALLLQSLGAGSMFGVMPAAGGNWKSTGRLVLAGSRGDVRLSDDWFEGAELLSLKWRSVGNYEISVPVLAVARDTTRVR